MSSEFTYPSFKCVLEYLEANKRIHICSRSKTLQKIDKKIPLHIEYLNFSESSIRINHIAIYLSCDDENFNNREQVLVNRVFRTWDEVLMPGDVCMTDGEFFELSNTENLYIRNIKPFKIEFYQKNNSASRVAPEIPYNIAMKKAATVLFGGRCPIHVSNLEICDSILRLPVDINIRIKSSLNVDIYNLDELLCIIDPQSFPLKTIEIIPNTPESYYHQIVQTAETLKTWPDRSEILRDTWQREVLTMPHKHIKLKMVDSEHEAMMSVVQDWLDHPREHGRTLAVWDTNGRVVESLYQIKKRFNGRVVLIPGNNDKGAYPKALIIPIDSTSELLVSSVKDKEIKLVSIPTGTIHSTVHADLTYRDVMQWYSSRIQKYFERNFILVMLLIFILTIGFATTLHATNKLNCVN